MGSKLICDALRINKLSQEVVGGGKVFIFFGVEIKFPIPNLCQIGGFHPLGGASPRVPTNLVDGMLLPGRSPQLF